MSHLAYAPQEVPPFLSCTPAKRTAQHHCHANKKAQPYHNNLSPKSLAPLCANLFGSGRPERAVTSAIATKLLR
jgi:hypothetical protein